MNAVTGTPLYLSPEAVTRADQVDARADVYAVGAVGYYLLTGTPVFRGSSVMEICMQHVKAAPEPPSARLGRTVSPDLEALVLRCLAKSPADRPHDAAQLLGELETSAVEGVWTAGDAATWWAARDESAQRGERAAAVTLDQPPMPQQRPAPDATMAFEGDTRKP
jgi:hypothetical protein